MGREGGALTECHLEAKDHREREEENRGRTLGGGQVSIPTKKKVLVRGPDSADRATRPLPAGPKLD